MKREKNIGTESRGQSAKSKELRAESRKSEVRSPKLAVSKAQLTAVKLSVSSGQPATSNWQQVTSNKPPIAIGVATREFSTVFHIKNLPLTAEGCISESRAIRACLMIRVFNN